MTQPNLIQSALQATGCVGVMLGLAAALLGPERAEASAVTNRALALDGQQAYLEVPASAALQEIADAFTLEAAFCVDSFSPNRGSVNTLLRKNVQAGAENFFLRFRNAPGLCLIELNLGRGLGLLQAPAQLQTNRWYHLAGTYDGRQITLYLNGVRIKAVSASGRLKVDASPLMIGRGDPQYSAGEYFHGWIDEVRLWKVARSPAELQAALNQPLTGKEAGLVAYWNFDEGTAKDASGNGNDGRLGGPARVEVAARPVLEAVPAAALAERPSAGPSLSPAKRVEVLEAMWRVLNEVYPALEYKGIRGHEWIEPALARARTVTNDRDFYELLLEQLASLKDTHTRVLSYPDQPLREGPAVFLNLVEGRVAVVRADPATTLCPGEVLVSLDGRPIADCLQGQLRRVCGSTERARARGACGQLLLGTPGTALTLEVQGTNGRVRQVVLHRDGNPRFEQEPAVSTRRLRGGIGYIRIAHWTDETIPAQVDQALETFKTARGVIFDVRGNGGGNDHLADVVNGRLIAQPVVSSIDFWRQAGTDQYRRTIGWVQPRGPWTYTGRVAALIDEASTSACEHFVSGLEATGRVLLVGLPTNGAGGGPTAITLPDGTRLAVSRALGLRANGVVFEGHGIPPHLQTPPSLNDLRTGRDAALEAALDWIASDQALPARIQELSGH